MRIGWRLVTGPAGAAPAVAAASSLASSGSCSPGMSSVDGSLSFVSLAEYDVDRDVPSASGDGRRSPPERLSYIAWLPTLRVRVEVSPRCRP
jgi:hypothetical protein